MSYGNDDLSAPDSAKKDTFSNDQKIYTNDLNNSKQKMNNSPIKLIDFSKGFQINKEALE